MKLDKQTKSEAAAYILGLSPITTIRGTKEEISAFTEALKSSRALYKILNEADDPSSVATALAEKSARAQVFAEVCGQSWPF